MERNIRIEVEYEGTRYHGWQIQENADTIQGRLTEAVRRLTGESVTIIGAGRTDAGVHARGQVANFFMQKDLPLHNIEAGLNAYLPRDIVVKSATEVPAEFNARFSARKRVYHYYISPRRTALYRNFCWQFFQPFDPQVLQRLAETIRGEHDFGAFSRMEVQSDHKRCIVYESRWFQDRGMWVYRIVANRFLHGMVRTLVGTMMDVARGKLTEEQFLEIFHSRDRTAAGPAAPAKGLILEAVEYEERALV
ncbi:MAG: tRNA pseudouridine(38-40) synthase TruA [Calditrichaeota bacterium]|nr:tRNA pseudouridine(38-40) synthase TruA [Calditrichota bacterium]